MATEVDQNSLLCFVATKVCSSSHPHQPSTMDPRRTKDPVELLTYLVEEQSPKGSFDHPKPDPDRLPHDHCEHCHPTKHTKTSSHLVFPSSMSSKLATLPPTTAAQPWWHAELPRCPRHSLMLGLQFHLLPSLISSPLLAQKDSAWPWIYRQCSATTVVATRHKRLERDSTFF